jgi:hypothetical protein
VLPHHVAGYFLNRKKKFMKKILPAILASVAFLFSSFYASSQNCSLLTHNAFTNFNGTRNASATSLWLNIHTKLDNTDLVNNGDYLLFTGGAITLTGVTATPMVTAVPIPDGKIIADNTVTKPITSYDLITNTWTTRVPPGFSTSDIFISGGIINSSTGFSVGGGKSSTITGYFYSNRPSFKQSWFYGLAAYQPPFSYSAVSSPGQVAAVGGGVQAGTPIPEEPYLVAGGSGGGGSNFTGSNSSTDNFTTCQKAVCNFSSSFTKTDVTCNGAGNGTITVTVTGGTGPYTYTLNGTTSFTTSASVYTFNNVAPGTYHIVITDSGGCTTDLTATVLQPDALQIADELDYNTTCIACDTIYISVTGGTFPYFFKWNTGATTPDVLVGPGTYTVTVTDGNGCTISLTQTVNVAPTSTPAGARNGIAATFGNTNETTITRVYPNPSNGLMYLQVESGENANSIISVIDMSGRVVKSFVVNLVKGANYTQLQLPMHAAGLYMLQIKTSNGIRTLPILFNK